MEAKREDFISLMLEETYAHSERPEATLLDFEGARAKKLRHHPLRIHYQSEIGCFRIYPADDLYLDCPRTWACFRSLVEAGPNARSFRWEIRPQNDDEQLLEIFTFLQGNPVVGIDVGWGEDRQLYWVLLTEEMSKNSSSAEHLFQDSDYCKSHSRRTGAL